MTATATVVSLLVFEAADCLMAVPASEVGHLENGPDSYIQKKGQTPFCEIKGQTPFFDLSEYFGGRESDGPWLHWGRDARRAWLRVRRVVDVVPIALSGLTPMPTLLRGDRSGAFLAAGVRGNEVFLLLDPARLSS